MQHGQKIHNQPINLLRKTGNKILDIPDGHLCCGSAGTYNILQPKIAKQLLKQKVENTDERTGEIQILDKKFISILILLMFSIV